jgi:hypothetical protein
MPALFRMSAKSSFVREKEISTEWVAIDTRNGRVIHRSKNHIDKKFVAEWYDIPTSFIEIKIKTR